MTYLFGSIRLRGTILIYPFLSAIAVIANIRWFEMELPLTFIVSYLYSKK